MSLADIEPVKHHVSETIEAFRELLFKFKELADSLEKGVIGKADMLLSLIRAQHYPSIEGELSKEATNRISQLLNVVEEAIKALDKVDLNDRGALEDLVRRLKDKLDEMPQVLDSLEELVLRPLHLHIARMYHEYLGLDRDLVLKVLKDKELRPEDISKLKAQLDEVIELISKETPHLKEPLREVILACAKSKGLDKDLTQRKPKSLLGELSFLLNYMSQIHTLLKECKGEYEWSCIEIKKSLLSKIHVCDDAILRDLEEHRGALAMGVKSLLGELDKVSKQFKTDIDSLHRVFAQQISFEPQKFTGVKDIKDWIDKAVEEASRLIKVRKSQELLETALKDIKDSVPEGSLNTYFRNTYFRSEYEYYLKKLHDLASIYEREVPRDITLLARCISRGGCIKESPEDVNKAVIDAIRERLDKLDKTLANMEEIGKRFCRRGEGGVVDLGDISSLRREVGDILGGSRAVWAYHQLLSKAQKASIRVLDCLGAKGTQEVEVDITDLDAELVKALLEVLRVQGMRVALRAFKG